MLENDFKKIHMIGIGGMGMSALAAILLEKNIKVTGSDIEATGLTTRLVKKGAKISTGHAAANLMSPDLVVYSSCIKKDNPEMLRARKERIPVIERGLLLKRIVEESARSVVVAGTHGKTTTTAVISFLLKKCGLDPTYLVGGILGPSSENAGSGRSGILVTESDESDGSFLYLMPDYGVITNIEDDHLDYYGSMGALVRAFEKFAGNVKRRLYYNIEDRHATRIGKRLKEKAFGFGTKRNPGIYARGIKLSGLGSRFNAVYKGEDLGGFHLSIPGVYNISNALPGIAIGLEFGAPARSMKKILGDFKGVARRFQFIGEAGGIKIVEDYAHHPTAISNVLKAALGAKPKRLVVVFQPHRYSRTRLLAREFAKSFRGADILILTDIYSASEKPIKGVGTENIHDIVKKAGIVKIAELMAKEKVKDAVASVAKAGDMILVLGAGDIGKVSREILDELRKRHV